MLLYNISTLQHRAAGSFTDVAFNDASITKLVCVCVCVFLSYYRSLKVSTLAIKKRNRDWEKVPLGLLSESLSPASLVFPLSFLRFSALNTCRYFWFHAQLPQRSEDRKALLFSRSNTSEPAIIDCALTYYLTNKCTRLEYRRHSSSSKTF